MIVKEIIETPRLSLRCLDPEAVHERYVNWLNDPVVNRFLEIRFQQHDLARVKSYVRDLNASESSLLVGVHVKETGRSEVHIGNMKIGPIDRHHLRGELSYFIGDRTYWGRGYATEAMSRLVNYAHDALGLVKITGSAYAANIASHKVYLRVGFVEEARLKRHWILDDQRVDEVLFAHFDQANR